MPLPPELLLNRTGPPITLSDPDRAGHTRHGSGLENDAFAFQAFHFRLRPPSTRVLAASTPHPEPSAVFAPPFHSCQADRRLNVAAYAFSRRPIAAPLRAAAVRFMKRFLPPMELRQVSVRTEEIKLN